jgi:hypothetical protein
VVKKKWNKVILIYSYFFFSVGATGLQISQFLQGLKGADSGEILPKQIYDMNQKTEELQDLALGLIPGCSDAAKTITKLET